MSCLHIAKKRKFTAEEDEILRNLVDVNGINNWKSISDQIVGRKPRECKERWENYLSPNIKISPNSDKYIKKINICILKDSKNYAISVKSNQFQSQMLIDDLDEIM